MTERQRYITVVYQLRDGLSAEHLAIDNEPESVVDRHPIIAASNTDEILRLEYIGRIAENDLLQELDEQDKLIAIQEILALPESKVTIEGLEEVIRSYKFDEEESE